uniref:carboxylesterase n=1 Tax=Anopheles christyi TaxID=43041 RepID=A0A182K574_9DIPT
MILVTFNYRLGPLGFLSTEDDTIPGNFGLKDQVIALQWIRENIESFGGDPDTVSLVGYSAGSASVHLHYISPLSKGLFTSGIAHSGTTLNPWTMAEKSTEKAKQIGAALNCPTERNQALLECLRKRPAADIVRQVPQFLDFLYNPFSPFGVVVEREGPLNPHPFLKETPRSLMKSGNIAKVPLIMSVTQAEGLYPGAEFISDHTYLQEIDSRWNELVPSILDYKTAISDPQARDRLSESIRNRYFNNDDRLSLNNVDILIRIMSNRLYFTGVTESIKLMQPHTKVYVYVDYFKIKYGIGEKLSKSVKTGCLGVSHGEDVDLIFHSISREHLPYTKEERIVINRFVAMYKLFSKGAAPRFGSHALPLQEDLNTITYLKLNYPKSVVVRASGLNDEEFWNSLDFDDAPHEAVACITAETVVNIKNGPITGERRGDYYAFEGIPYAKPPVGKLRFASSELNDDRWTAPRNATVRGPVCLQWNHLIPDENKLEGVEDCLFLNVYTRSIESTARLPTIAFIHGGALMFGTGNFYEPDHIMRRQMVLVTFNYRLGPLGFLSTEDDTIPGNFGLKDQVIALQWIRENIESFGGDPDTVSLVGYSAGSASVHLHYLSSLSRGLFTSGIGHSGSALSPWVMTERSVEKAIRIGAVLGCPTRKTQALLECLRKLPAEDIVRQVPQFLDFLYNPFSPFGVVVEREGPLNPHPFLTETPRSLMTSGNIAKVPLILSVTQAEGLYPGAEFISDLNYLQAIDSRWNELVPSILDYKTAVADPKARDRLSESIRNHYFGTEERLSLANFATLIRIISNRLYFAGVTESAKLMHPYTNVYVYYDLYKCKYGVGEALSHHDDPGLLGVAHGDDVLLIFPSVLREEIPFTDEEMQVVDRFVTMYESFAKGDQPRFGSYELPLQDANDELVFLELNYPQSKIVRAEGVSDELFWNTLDFNDGPYASPAPTHTELKLCALRLALIVTLSYGALASTDPPVVNIENGLIIGEKRGDYYAFEGIPYAKAPTGERRFAPSELNDETWTVPRNASTLGAYCMQWSHTITAKDKLFGEEDCLYLNVYTTSLDEAAATGLPTLFYIHGGAFMFGGGGLFSPKHVLRKPKIMVTFNYRVGPLGFLSSEDDVIPGNFGLKDQVTALQWVRKNIHRFGGDRERITLVGFSAGAASVHLHYLSPMSRGLFQNGIAHSGAALNPWVMAEDSARKTLQIARHLGCSEERLSSSQAVLACLRERPAEDIVRQVPSLLDYLYNPFTPLGVVVEKQGKLNRRPFLADHPAVLSRKGKLTKVPLILSVTQAEGLYPGAEFISNGEYLPDIDARWYDLLPSILDYKSAVPEGEKRDELSKAISEHYFGNDRKLSPDNFRDFVSILSNRLFFAGVTRTAKLLQPHIPVYFYYFNYKTAYGIGEQMSGTEENYGVAHGEDVLLSFPTRMRDNHPFTKDELRVVSSFVNLYDTFSQGQEPKYGDYLLPVQNITGKLQYMEVKDSKCEGCATAKTAYVVTLLSPLYGYASASVDVKVTIKNGPIIGQHRGEHFAFEGIPYAKAPIGNRRLAPSELIDERWYEPRNTSQVGPICLQWSHLKPGDDKMDGAEDCLFLNVYTPNLSPDTPLPTIVHLHGGAFMYGGGGYFRPDFLLKRPLILVTVNYRLGPLGFLSTEDDVIAGNFGLKDQVTALQWVQKNIKYFGGDANRVTLSGFSAGSASVHLHYLSPLSRGLFQRAIGHSGSALNPWVMVERAAEKTNMIAAGVGCPVNGSSKELLHCLRQIPAEEIVRQVPKLQDFLYNPYSPLGVVVEKRGKYNPQPFLFEHPRNLTRAGKVAKVPLLLSVTEAEGLYPAAEFFSNASYLRHINDHWNEVIPSILDYKYAVRDVHLRDALSQVIRERYLGANELNERVFPQFVRLVSNRLFFAGVTEMAKMMQPHIPVYFYLDEYKATYGLSEALAGSDQFLGVPHGEDILFIYPSSLRDGHPYTAQELGMVSKFVDLYESFAYGLQPRFGDLLLPVQEDTSRHDRYDRFLKRRTILGCCLYRFLFFKMAALTDAVLDALVFEHLSKKDKTFAAVFQKKFKSPTLPKGAPKLDEIVTHYQSTKKKLMVNNSQKAEESDSEEEEDSDEEDEEEETPAPVKKAVTNGKSATNGKAAAAKKPQQEEDDDEDSDDDDEEEDSDEEEDEKPAAKPVAKAAPAKAAVTPLVKKPQQDESEDEDDDSEEDDSDEEEKPAAQKPQQLAGQKRKAQEEEEEDDDEDDEDEDEEEVAPKAAPAKPNNAGKAQAQKNDRKSFGGFDNRNGNGNNDGGFNKQRGDFNKQRGDNKEQFGERKRPEIGPDDWNCESCGQSNFKSRQSCFKCSTKNPNGVETWCCPSCSFDNFASRWSCKKCQAENPNGSGGGGRGGNRRSFGEGGGRGRGGGFGEGGGRGRGGGGRGRGGGFGGSGGRGGGGFGGRGGGGRGGGDFRGGRGGGRGFGGRLTRMENY